MQGAADPAIECKLTATNRVNRDASRRGMTATDILARTRGSIVWAAFYGTFVVAAAVHAAIGIRNVLAEWASLSDRRAGLAAGVFGGLLLLLGLRAVAAVVLP